MLKIPSNIPFGIDRSPFFYGWIILFAGIVGVLMSVPGQTMGVSVFTDHLIKDLNVTRVQLSLAYLIGTATSGLIITYAGILYDRMGARVIAIGAGVMIGAMLIYLTNIDNISVFLVRLFNLTDAENVMIPLLVFGFFGIRFFGQGVLTMTSRNMVMKWFDKRRGFANAILGAFTSLGFSISPAILQGLIDTNGWRDAWISLAVLAGIIFTVFAFFVFRDNPEDAGLIPDGKIIKQKKTKLKTTSERDYTLREAIRTYSFWIFNLNLTMFALYFTAMTFHVESVFRYAGYSNDVAVSIFPPASIIALIFTFVGSWLSDYTRLKYFLLLNLFGMMISFTGFIYLKESFGIPLLIIGNGISNGMFGILISITWPRFFGTKHLGSISGFVMSCTVIGSAIGPFLLSLSEKYTKNYNGSIILLAAITTVLFILAFKANNVNDRQKSGDQ